MPHVFLLGVAEWLVIGSVGPEDGPVAGDPMAPNHPIVEIIDHVPFRSDEGACRLPNADACHARGFGISDLDDIRTRLATFPISSASARSPSGPPPGSRTGAPPSASTTSGSGSGKTASRSAPSASSPTISTQEAQRGTRNGSQTPPVGSICPRTAPSQDTRSGPARYRAPPALLARERLVQEGHPRGAERGGVNAVARSWRAVPARGWLRLRGYRVMQRHVTLLVVPYG